MSNPGSDRYSVGVAGFRGYGGEELLRLFARHPAVTPVLLEHREDSLPRPEPIHHPSPLRRLPCTPEAVSDAGLAVVFLATPLEVSLDLAPKMLSAGVKAIDLSGAFRLGTPERFERWYRKPHDFPALLAEAVYGLPELNRAAIAGARLVANPGCYPTAANLAIRPLVEAGIADLRAGIVCDAKSGVSGAGRKPSLSTSFCEVAENFSAYAVLEHRHVPEILMVSGLAEGDLSFTAHLLPIDRGILETVYFRSTAPSSAEALLSIYSARYAREPFVRLYPAGSLPDVHAVSRTNFCDIGVVFDSASGRGVVVAAIDNLGKGAAGQAVQNMNLMLGLPETAGLL